MSAIESCTTRHYVCKYQVECKSERVLLTQVTESQRDQSLALDDWIRLKWIISVVMDE